MNINQSPCVLAVARLSVGVVYYETELGAKP